MIQNVIPGRKLVLFISTLFLGAALTCSITAPASAQDVQWPAVDGSAFAMLNKHIATEIRAFDTKGRDLMAFDLALRGRSLYGRFHELVCAGGSFIGTSAGTYTSAQVNKAGEFTIEATLTPASAEQEKQGVVICFANNEGEDFAILQGKEGFLLRLKNNEPVKLFQGKANETIHLLVSCGRQTWTSYCNGIAATSGKMPEGASAWGDRDLIMGSDWLEKSPWFGRMQGIAVFPKALTADEAAAQAKAMKTLISARKPATQVRFQGTLLQQAKTSHLKDIQPYTRSLTAATYKVDKVLAGKWDEPTINVYHWMIMDSKRLPLADRQTGLKVELTVEPMKEQPQLKSDRRDEIEELDIDAQFFYCESEM